MKANVITIYLLISILSSGLAQTTKHGLAQKQDEIQSLMKRLENGIERLIEIVEKDEPENAKRLRESLKKIKEYDIAGIMEDINNMIKNQEYDQAVNAQKNLIKALSSILQSLMLAEDLDKQIESIERWKQNLEKINSLKQHQLLKKQSIEKALKDKSENLEKKQDTSERLLNDRKESNTKEDLEKLLKQIGDYKTKDKVEEDLKESVSKNISEAKNFMENAKASLENKNLEKTLEGDNEAISKMEKSENQIKDYLAQVEKKYGQNLKDILESKLNAILSNQIVINQNTLKLENKLANEKGYRDRADLIALKKLGKEEVQLLEETKGVLDIIKDEESIIRQMISGITDDMNLVADRLDKGFSDRLTLDIEKEIEVSIRDILDAIKGEFSNKDSKGENSGNKTKSESGSKKDKENDNKIVDIVSELKLIRNLQLRVNHMTISWDRVKNSKEDKGEYQNDMDKTLASKQAHIAHMMEEIAKKLEEK